MTGGDAEKAVGRVVGPGLDPAEAVAAPGIGGAEVIQHVEVLLAEGERALGAVDLEVVLHLAPRRDPVALDAARGAVPEPQEGAAHIVGGHRPAAAPPVGTLADHGDAIAHDAGDGAAQELGRGQRMAADIGQRPAARRVVAERVGAVRIGHVVFAVNAAIAADLTQFAGGDHVPGEGQHRVAEIVEADLGLHASGLGDQGHLQSIGGQGRQRLFAIDMLAGSDRGQRHFLVQGVGCRDRDQIDLGVRDDGAPVGGGSGKAQRPGGAGGGFGGDVGDRVQVQVVVEFEHARRRGEAEHMGLAHEAGADQADVQARFGHVRQSLFTISAGSRRPAKWSSTFRTEEMAMRSAHSRVRAAICGVRMACGRAFSG